MPSKIAIRLKGVETTIYVKADTVDDEGVQMLLKLGNTPSSESSRGTTSKVGGSWIKISYAALCAGSLAVEFQNSDRLTVLHASDYELIPRPFAIATGVTVPTGGYDYQNGQVSYLFGQQRTLSGTFSYEEGSLYRGRRRTVGVAAGRIRLSPQFAIEPIASVNWVKLPWGDLTRTVVSARHTYSLTPRMFVSALVQYNSSINTLSTNARLRWEYQPGSELFVVYSDGRDTGPAGFPELMNRAFVIKINRLFRFWCFGSRCSGARVSLA